MYSVWSLPWPHGFYHLDGSIPDMSDLTPVDRLSFLGNSVGNDYGDQLPF